MPARISATPTHLFLYSSHTPFAAQQSASAAPNCGAHVSTAPLAGTMPRLGTHPVEAAAGPTAGAQALGDLISRCATCAITRVIREEET